MPSIIARRLRACAFWNDEAGATVWSNSQTHKTDSARLAGEREAARLWAQAKRLHAQADAAEIAEAA